MCLASEKVTDANRRSTDVRDLLKSMSTVTEIRTSDRHPYAGLFFILLSVALVGVSAGGEFYERHLNIMLFVAISAIVIFAIPLAATTIIAVMALTQCLFFQIHNPSITLGSVEAATLFFAAGIIATIVSRRTMTSLAQKTFLLELRDKSRVAELAAANARLELLARADPLIGIANRRWMMELLNR